MRVGIASLCTVNLAKCVGCGWRSVCSRFTSARAL